MENICARTNRVIIKHMVQNCDSDMKHSLFNDKLPTLYKHSCHLFLLHFKVLYVHLLTIQRYGSIQLFRYVVVGCFAFISVGGHGGCFSTWWRGSRRFSNESARPVAKVEKYVGKTLSLLLYNQKGYAALHFNCCVAVLIVC